MTEAQILARSDAELLALVGAGALAGLLICALLELWRKRVRGY